jgi:solute carrier family 25 (mitochondrial uncoupling protein), member 8/9
MSFTEFITSGISVSTANIITCPIDTVKTRLQLQRASGQKPLGMVKMASSIVKNEGFVYLFNGIEASILRGIVFGGARLGMYMPIKTALYGDKKTSFTEKVTAGSLSGGAAAVVSSPIELLKTRLQSSNETRSTVEVFKRVLKENGVKGLWKGAVPGMARASILTASQCATYDEVKNFLVSKKCIQDGLQLHFVSSMIAGLVTTTITNPLDVIKTHMYVGGAKYSNPVKCAVDVFRANGISGFMKGWLASYARLGPHTVIMFVVAEKLRNYTGLTSI